MSIVYLYIKPLEPPDGDSESGRNTDEKMFFIFSFCAAALLANARALEPYLGVYKMTFATVRNNITLSAVR